MLLLLLFYIALYKLKIYIYIIRRKKYIGYALEKVTKVTRYSRAICEYMGITIITDVNSNKTVTSLLFRGTDTPIIYDLVSSYMHD